MTKSSSNAELIIELLSDFSSKTFFGEEKEEETQHGTWINWVFCFVCYLKDVEDESNKRSLINHRKVNEEKR